MSPIDLLARTRAFTLSMVEELDDDQLLAIPDDASNNILWNLGHLVVTQQLLHYGLSGLALRVPDGLVAQCRKGTRPADWSTPPDIDQVRAWMVELPERLAEDAAQGRFATFRRYPTSTGIVLESFEDALHFNNYHEGLHAGVILRLRRQVA